MGNKNIDSFFELTTMAVMRYLQFKKLLWRGNVLVSVCSFLAPGTFDYDETWISDLGYVTYHIICNHSI